MSPKNFIIHVTSGNAQELKTILHQNELFTKYYDGWEATMCASTGTKQSERFYYYDITHSDMGAMVRYLQSKRAGFAFKVKIQKKGLGNHRFD